MGKTTFKIYTKQKLAIDNLKSNNVLLAEDQIYDNRCIKRYCIFNSYDDVNAVLEKGGHFYEVFLENKRCNFFVDLDITDDEGRRKPKQRVEAYNEIIKKHLINYCKQQGKDISNEDIHDLILRSPDTIKKASFHIIYRINGVYFNDVRTCKNFYEYMTVTHKENLLGLDQIYNKSRTFRLLNNSKIDNPQCALYLDNPQTLENKLLTLGSYVIDKEDDFILNNITIKKQKQQTQPQTIQTVDIDIVDSLLNCLSGQRSYQEWNNLGILLYCLFNGSNDGLDRFKRFGRTKAPDGYDENTYNNYWESYGSLQEFNYKIGTLYYWAKQENPDAYNNLMKEIYNTDYINGSHRDVAELYVKRFSNKILKSDEGFFFFDEKTGIWKQEAKCLSQIQSGFDKLIKEIKGSKIPGDHKPDSIESISNTAKDGICEKLKNASYKQNIISELNWLLYVEETHFNNNKHLLPFTNGVYDLKENCFRPAHYDEYVVSTTGYKYVKADTKPVLNLLRDIFPNQDLLDYVLRSLASYLPDIHNKEEFFIWFNKRGSNGKSTLIELINLAFGNFSYACKPSLLLEEKFQNAEGPTPTLMKMKGKRFISYQEPPIRNVKLEVNSIKRLTGGDTLNGRKLREDTETFKLNAMNVMCANELPLLNGTDGGIIRRLRVIKFETEFKLNPTKDYQRPLREINKEELRDPLINLLISYYYLWLEDKTVPDCVWNYTKMYLDKSNLIGAFCSKYLIKTDNGFFTKNDLKCIFEDKAISREYELYNKKFSTFCNDIEDELDSTFLDRKKINGNNLYGVMCGFKLVQPEGEHLLIEETNNDEEL